MGLVLACLLASSQGLRRLAYSTTASSLGGTTQAVRQVSTCYSTPSCQGNSQLLIDSATY